MAVRRKETAAILPKPGPDAFAVGLRELQGVQCGTREELKPAFAHRGRELFQFWFEFKEKHEPVRVTLVTVFAHEAGEVEVRRQKIQARFLARFPGGTRVGRFADLGLEFTAARAPTAEVGRLGALEQEDFIAGVEAVKQRGDLVRQRHNIIPCPVGHGRAAGRI